LREAKKQNWTFDASRGTGKYKKRYLHLGFPFRRICLIRTEYDVKTLKNSKVDDGT